MDENENMAKKRILIVDDEKPIAELIAEFCQMLGYEVEVLLSGKEALETVKKFHPDVITLDLSMPEVSGSQVLTVLKKDESARSIPVIVISSLVGTESQELKREEIKSTSGLMPKPVTIQNLKEMIAKALPKNENKP